MQGDSIAHYQTDHFSCTTRLTQSSPSHTSKGVAGEKPVQGDFDSGWDDLRDRSLPGRRNWG